MPVYELIANLGIFAVIWALRRRSGPDGRLFLIYLILYSVMRFTLAFASSYQVVAFGLTQSQIVALAALTISVPLGIWALSQKSRVRPA
jgi:phosphatidylglycerol:prolipoprotein diacylglycerol transferase